MNQDQRVIRASRVRRARRVARVTMTTTATTKVLTITQLNKGCHSQSSKLFPRRIVLRFKNKKWRKKGEKNQILGKKIMRYNLLEERIRNSVFGKILRISYLNAFSTIFKAW